MKVVKSDDNLYNIYICGKEKGFAEVTVFRGLNLKTMKRYEWKINWASIGSVDVAIAQEFVDALNAAIKIAKGEQL